MSVDEIYGLTGIDPWFLAHLALTLVEVEGRLRAREGAWRPPAATPCCARGQARRVLRPPARPPVGPEQARGPPRALRPAPGDLGRLPAWSTRVRPSSPR
ncbi:MAG: hypothetical protein U0835_23725 [Isosphaeraceae bacterium]